MTKVIVGLLSSGVWEVIFTTLFFFGLFFFLLSIIGSFGDEDADVDGEADSLDMEGELVDLDGDGIPDGIDLDGDGVPDIDLDGTDLDMDVDFEAELDSGFDTEFDTDLDSDIGEVSFETEIDDEFQFSNDAFQHLEIDSFDAERQDEVQIYESKYKMGEIATFNMFFGMVGWFYVGDLTDLRLAIALLIGLAMMKAFGLFIAKYTKTVVVPIKSIRRGDIAQVRYSVTPDKAGLVLIPRRDGVISTEMAKGAFAHDNFAKGEKGYVWGKESGFYLITKGIRGQPDLAEKEPTKPTKKALDL